MAPPLQAILKSELARGNRIAEVGDWPPGCDLLVILSRPFARRYMPAPGVTYRDIDDPHYWKAEYSYERECLACQFGR